MFEYRGRFGDSPRIVVCSLSVLAILSGCEQAIREHTDTDTDTDGAGIVSIGDDSSDDSGDASDNTDTSSDAETGEQVRYCGDAELVVTAVTPRVMLVLDKSRSMVTSSWDHDGDPSTPTTTRWHSLHETVAELVSDQAASIELGAVMFPSAALANNDAATACDVSATPDVGVALGNDQAILAAMPDADSLEIWGGTPTAAGITTATEALRLLAGDAPRAIVLVTDGAANCSASAGPSQTFTQYDEDLAPLVAAIAAEGIATYVVGIDIVDAWVQVPAANPHDRLAEVALAGGVAKAGDEPFYNTRDELELFTALDDITHQLQCTITVADLPATADRVHLMIDGVMLDYVPGCDTTGWRYADDGEIELCASACDDFVDGGTMQGAFDCIPEA